MRADPEKLHAFAEELGSRAALLLRPVVSAEVFPHARPAIIALFRLSMLDKRHEGQKRCLNCDKPGQTDFKARIDAKNPLVELEEDVIVRLLCCGGEKCVSRVEYLADCLFYNDKFKQALDAVEGRVS